MPRYVALLRGVMPQNAKMPELVRCFEAAGFTKVRTVLASGNVAFDARRASEAALARRAEEAMRAGLGRGFDTIVRSSAHLQELVATDPYAGFELPALGKRIVTFLRRTDGPEVSLPIVQEGLHVLRRAGGEVLSVYEPNPKGPVFMTLLERTFGKEITTRTFETVRKCARA